MCKFAWEKLLTQVTDSHRHAWMSYMVGDPPTVDKLLQRQVRIWEPEEHRPVLSATRSAFKTYSTYVLSKAVSCSASWKLTLLQHEEQDSSMAAHGSIKMKRSRPSLQSVDQKTATGHVELKWVAVRWLHPVVHINYKGGGVM